MNVQRYILASIIVFAFMLVIDWLFHGVILSGWYNEILQLHRTGAYGGIYLFWLIIGFLLLSFGFCFIFTKGYQNKGIGEGLRYGFYVGIAFSISTILIAFAVMPFPTKWIIAWIIGNLIILILAGMILAAIYKPKTI